MAQNSDNLFSESNRVSGPARRRILHTLTRIWENLRITDADGANMRRVTVMEPPEGKHYRIEVHTIHFEKKQSRLAEGQSVRVINSDNGVPIGAWGRIENVAPRQDTIVYTLGFPSEAYRNERRDAFRVPIETGDGVDAEILSTPDFDAITCHVHDLSMTGAWLEISRDSSEQNELDLTPNSRYTVGLRLPNQKNLAYSDALIVWIDSSNDTSSHIGVTWDQPEPEFERDLRRFVMNKERELAKRRSRA